MPVTAVPDLLTVEEAARVMRIGRTKAYALAREWRTSNGRSGLPVVDLGHVLRVPREQLEQVIGTALNGPVPDAVIVPPATSTAVPSAPDGLPEHAACSAPVPIRPNARRTRLTRRSVAPSSQPGLFDLPDPAA